MQVTPFGIAVVAERSHRGERLAVWCCVMSSDAVWCRLVLLGTVLCRLIPFGAVWCRLVLSGAAWCRLMPLGAVWCLLVSFGAIRCCLVPRAPDTSYTCIRAHLFSDPGSGPGFYRACASREPSGY